MTNKDHFHTMVTKSEAWIKAMADALRCDEHHAYAVLRAVLHALRDRMPVENAAQLAAQMPTIIRGVFYEGWTPSGKPVRIRQKEDFLEAVWTQLNKPEDLDVERSTKTALRILCDKVSEGEAQNIAHVLPEHLRELLPKGVYAA